MDFALFFLIWVTVYALFGAIDSLTDWNARYAITKATKSSATMTVVDSLTILFGAITLWEALKQYFPSLSSSGFAS